MTFPSSKTAFPFLFGRAFIEATWTLKSCAIRGADFPSFLEGLSLRPLLCGACRGSEDYNFPSFLEGLSLRRVPNLRVTLHSLCISLPFWKGFH